VSDLSRPAAPSVVAAGTTATDGGPGGQLAAGTYQYRVTFVNNVGVESNPSATFSVSGVAAADVVTLNNLPTSSDPTIVARRIYRTPANGTLSGLIVPGNDTPPPPSTDRGATAGAPPGNPPPPIPPVTPAGLPVVDGSRALAPVGTATANAGGTGMLKAGTYV